MTELLTARNITLHELETTFHLQQTEDPAFFPEWQQHTPPINEQETHFLDKLKAGYMHLVKYPPVLENTVQMAIIAPLLFLADFYLPPFRITSEVTVGVTNMDEDHRVEGKIDVLVLKDSFWVMIIESKQVAFSLEAGLPQLLAYMLANPHPDSPNIGLITNGGSFMFIKLVAGEQPRYGVSRVFEMRNPGNDLAAVLAILKQIRQLFVLA
jgi:hypothetical protein